MSTEMQLADLRTNVAALSGIVVRHVGHTATLSACLQELTNELKRANDIHARTLEGLQAMMRGDDDWWKG